MPDDLRAVIERAREVVDDMGPLGLHLMSADDLAKLLDAAKRGLEAEGWKEARQWVWDEDVFNSPAECIREWRLEPGETFVLHEFVSRRRTGKACYWRVTDDRRAEEIPAPPREGA